MRASRREAALARQPRRDRFLIEFYNSYQQPREGVADPSGISFSFCNSRINSAVVCCRLYAIIFFLGINRIVHGAISGFSNRKLSHSSLRARLRTTDERLYFFPHTIPQRTLLPGAVMAINPGDTDFFPSRRTRSKSALRVSLSSFRSVRLPECGKECKVKDRPLVLRGQFSPAFLAAALNDQTACTGSHAGKKTDTAFAATIRGLKSSFHFIAFLFFYPDSIRKIPTLLRKAEIQLHISYKIHPEPGIFNPGMMFLCKKSANPPGSPQ